MSHRGATAAVFALLAAPVACQHHEPAPSPTASDEAGNTYDARVRPFIARHCLPCHDAVGASGELSFDPDATAEQALARPHVWRRVRERLERGEMPPVGQPRRYWSA